MAMLKTLTKGTTAKLLAEREQAAAERVAREQREAAVLAIPNTIRSYAEAARVLAGGIGDRRKLANNTYLVRRADGEIAVMLHETDVVIYYHDGTVKFDSGGWRTPTTRERINQYSPATVMQQAGVWLINALDSTVTFADGMALEINQTMNVAKWINMGPPIHELLTLRDQVKRYVDEFMRLFDEDQVPAPSNGDCWHCLFTSGDNATIVGAPSTSHLVEHMRERYYVPSLVMAAIKRYPVSDVAKAYLRAKFHGRGSQVIASTTERVGRAQVKLSAE